LGGVSDCWKGSGWWKGGKLTLEADTGNITLRLTLATETSEEDLVVLVDKVQATIIGDYF